MRRSGKTTRAIDEAVQKLFTHEIIIVPKTAYSTTPETLLNSKFPVCVDPNYMDGYAQREFLYALRQRLKNEHPHVKEVNNGSVVLFKV